MGKAIVPWTGLTEYHVRCRTDYRDGVVVRRMRKLLKQQKKDFTETRYSANKLLRFPKVRHYKEAYQWEMVVFEWR